MWCSLQLFPSDGDPILAVCNVNAGIVETFGQDILDTVLPSRESLGSKHAVADFNHIRPAGRATACEMQFYNKNFRSSLFYFCQLPAESSKKKKRKMLNSLWW